MLVIELDGGQHAEHLDEDALRTAKLESLGYRIIRFWNDAVLQETQSVLDAVAEALARPAPHPNPLPGGGEGDTRATNERLR